MNMNSANTSRLGVLLAALLFPVVVHADAGLASPAALSPRAAERTANAARAMMLDAERAGDRLVAVGDRGVILLSDDHGRAWRQAARVPLDATLTAVSFVDDRYGWAVGHWGAILHTEDGGDTWTTQRIDTDEDRPLFSVRFLDRQRGVAVGLWSLMLRTVDGGRTWTEVSLPSPEGRRADANLMHIFSDRSGALYAVGERGSVFRSRDGGDSWTAHATGYRGTFWSGTALDDGALIVAGMRGSLYRSVDQGAHWMAISTGSGSSITDVVQIGGKVFAVALDGVTLESSDDGLHFTLRQRADRLSMTAAVATGREQLTIFSRTGVLADRP
ncbi:YCF48-related protein [Azoarcus sp. DD4]|uniref:WD40/YVTN/BNR-like repeat-containing protein n=1 Tax=Azoarcus sp. DD4 TaxID=2027405 RepID=UPI00197AB105|nr:YCF48-related protein [Azoarcus sp. DD4]